MGGLFAVVLLESGGQLFVLNGDFSPFLVPAFEIEKLDPARDAANVRIGMIGRDFHAHFELAAARQAARGEEQLFRFGAVEHVSTGFVYHESSPSRACRNVFVLLFAPGQGRLQPQAGSRVELLAAGNEGSW